LSALIDSPVAIDHLRGVPEAHDLIDAALGRGQRLLASEVTRIEVLAGMRDAEELATRSLLSNFELVPVDEPVAERAAALARTYRSAHPGIDLADYVIAATAITEDAALCTLNLRDFPMFPELERPY
jgi:predicted nucleic acid-binding protein